MRNITILLFAMCLSFYGYSQTAVTLDADPITDFGYTLENRDTTIVLGESVVLGENLGLYGGTGDYTYLWLPASLLDDINSATPTATPTSSTVFYQTVTDGNGCRFTIEYEVTVISESQGGDGTEIVDVDASSFEVYFYPNPAENYINLEVVGQEADFMNISIFDNTGKKLKAYSISDFDGEYSQHMELDLPGGAYNLIVETDEDKVEQQLFIK